MSSHAARVLDLGLGLGFRFRAYGLGLGLGFRVYVVYRELTRALQGVDDVVFTLRPVRMSQTSALYSLSYIERSILFHIYSAVFSFLYTALCSLSYIQRSILFPIYNHYRASAELTFENLHLSES